MSPRASGPPEGQVRLQKYLAAAGVASRRKAEELIERGHVAVNGKTVRRPGTKVDPERDHVTVRGQSVQPEQKVYYVLHKPDGVVCTASDSVDERGRPTILSLLRSVSERVYPVGRLDYHSRGLLLLTNDGELAAALAHPRHKVPKIYHVKFQGRLSEEELEALGEGITLEDGTRTKPATELMRVRDTAANTWVQIGVAQGLNRQLRRMGDAIGHPVLKIIRVAIGDLTLDGIEEGTCRPLTQTEVDQLRSWTDL